MTTKSYLGITAHYGKNGTMQSAIIGVVPLEQSHTSDYIKDVLRNTLNEWGIPLHKVVACCTDGAANMKKAVLDLLGTGSHIVCFAHSLNLVVTQGITSF